MPTFVCYASPDPVYGPAMRIISAITNARVPQVTTTSAHGYVDGTIVRFDIPPADGMQQLNQLTSPIIVTGSTTFTFAIDTTQFDTFAIPVGAGLHTNICALVVPIGELNSTLKASLVNQL